MICSVPARRVAPLVACASLSLSGLVLGQVAPHTPAAAQTVARHQVTVDVGGLTVGIAYGRRLGTGRVSVGGGVWAGWEPRTTLHRSFFQPVGVELFARSQITPSVQLEAGPSVLYYFWADDCGTCGGTFLGLHGAALVGRRSVFVGPTLRLGWATGGPQPDEVGLVYGVQLRLLLGWGR